MHPCSLPHSVPITLGSRQAAPMRGPTVCCTLTTSVLPLCAVLSPLEVVAWARGWHHALLVPTEAYSLPAWWDVPGGPLGRAPSWEGGLAAPLQTQKLSSRTRVPRGAGLGQPREGSRETVPSILMYTGMGAPSGLPLPLGSGVHRSGALAVPGGCLSSRTATPLPEASEVHQIPGRSSSGSSQPITPPAFSLLTPKDAF